MKAKIHKHCKGCKLLSTTGIKDGVHNNWCCHFGKHALKAVGQCKQTGFRELIPKETT